MLEVCGWLLVVNSGSVQQQKNNNNVLRVECTILPKTGNNKHIQPGLREPFSLIKMSCGQTW